MELPKKYKKQIMEFTEQYYELAGPKKIIVSVRKKFPLSVVWRGENKVETTNDREYDAYDWIYDSKEIADYNKKIDRFIERTVAFGRNKFKDKDWLWTHILWNFRPENGEKFNFKKVKWVADYED